MSGPLVARTIPSILKAVKEGKKLELVPRSKTWTAGGAKKSKTWGVLYLDGKETPIELNDVKVNRGLKTHTFDNKLAVSFGIMWTEEQVAEWKELEDLVIAELFVTFKDKLKEFDNMAEFKKYKWTGGMLKEKQVVDGNGLAQEGKFYPRSSFVDCPFAKDKGVSHPDFDIKNADGTDVSSWQKLVDAKLIIKRLYMSYEVNACQNSEYKVKLTCRQMILSEGGHVTIVSESDALSSSSSSAASATTPSDVTSNKRKADPVVPEPDKKIKVEPTPPTAKNEPIKVK